MWYTEISKIQILLAKSIIARKLPASTKSLSQSGTSQLPETLISFLQIYSVQKLVLGIDDSSSVDVGTIT